MKKTKSKCRNSKWRTQYALNAFIGVKKVRSGNIMARKKASVMIEKQMFLLINLGRDIRNYTVRKWKMFKTVDNLPNSGYRSKFRSDCSVRRETAKHSWATSPALQASVSMGEFMAAQLENKLYLLSKPWIQVIHSVIFLLRKRLNRFVWKGCQEKPFLS